MYSNKCADIYHTNHGDNRCEDYLKRNVLIVLHLNPIYQDPISFPLCFFLFKSSIPGLRISLSKNNEGDAFNYKNGDCNDPNNSPLGNVVFIPINDCASN